MTSWQEQYFNRAKVMPPEPKPRAVMWFVVFATVMILLPAIAVGVAWHLGYLNQYLAPELQSIQAVNDDDRPNRSRESDHPSYSGQVPSGPDSSTFRPNAAPQITQSRANELGRLITSRNNGIDLMTRDRAKAIERQQVGQASLTTARKRLIYLEEHRPAASNTGAVYQWNLNHSDAVAAAKNATSVVATQQKAINSFNDRITKATTEHDAAKDELDGAAVIP